MRLLLGPHQKELNASCLLLLRSAGSARPAFWVARTMRTKRIDRPCAEQQRSSILSSLCASPLSSRLWGELIARWPIRPDTWTVSGAIVDMGSSSLSMRTCASRESTSTRFSGGIVDSMAREIPRTMRRDQGWEIDEKPPRDRGGGRLKSHIILKSTRIRINVDQNAPRTSSVVDRVFYV